jgi:hypothetical protein
MAVLVCLLTPNISNSQSENPYSDKLTKSAIDNYRVGLYSGNYGIVKSCLYFAGKYRIKAVCQDLITMLKTSDDEELCTIALWSMFQIGDDYYCKQLRDIMINHPSENVKDCFNFLNKIKEYGNNLAINRI